MRFAFTDVSASGTVLVWCATPAAPTAIVPSRSRTYLRCRITRNNAIAVSPMMSAEIASVTQAFLPMKKFDLAELQRTYAGAGVTH